MKRQITTLATLLLVFVATIATAANPTHKAFKDLNSKEVIMSYVDASLLGNTIYAKEMFTNDFEYTNTINNDKHGKKSYLTYLKQLKNVTFNCTQKSEIIDQTGKTAVGKVTMDFGTFVRVDYITLIQSKEGWQINKVVTTYP